MTSQPKNVGILAMEIHFPPTRVVLEELEAHDGASKGKYTTAPGQDCMGFLAEDEDVVSISMTAVTYLLEKYAIDPKKIGRQYVRCISFAVCLSSLLFTTKALPLWLLHLLFIKIYPWFFTMSNKQEHGNTDIEGVDAHNSSYGGTAALFNCVNWVESSSWDGRYGLVVCTDSAVYAKGPARLLEELQQLPGL
ncbi:hypothetical protein HAX54_015015 [Datura stramonium]|uniref:Hydroxymethylglutaryl-coenzyme A synthase N-terminal domain-containing protein n=1 Tax=Datura stramonium TaxID=4076 RepID=A0ABS8RZU5_DATST|nr:hypothetical protein [Datura stramonium]